MLPMVRAKAEYQAADAHIPTATFPLQFYADDGIILAYSTDNLLFIYDEIRAYLRFFGLELSFEKCELLVTTLSKAHF